MSTKLVLPLAILFGITMLCAPACTRQSGITDFESGIGTEKGGASDQDPIYDLETEDPVKIESQSKFIGNWTVNETCTLSGTAFPYPVIITRDTSSQTLKLSGFYGPINSGGFIHLVNATINGTTITIPKQEPDNDAIYVEGTGTIDVSALPHTITMFFTVSDELSVPIVSSNCTAIFTR